MHSIDAHQHFWKFDPVRDAWITEEMQVIRKDFFPEDIIPLLQKNNFDGCVAVQANQSEDETNFLLDLAAANDSVKGVVGWVDLRAVDLEKKLDHYKQFKKLKGFRHILQGEKNRRLMLEDDFKKGIALLQKYNFTYDILIYTDQLAFTKEFVQIFPTQEFVIDHLAKPDIKNKNISEWKSEITSIAKHENVYCKVSGMVTEADWKNWKQEDFEPYLDVITNAFGTERIMFGTDWPVCLLAASYKEVVDIARNYFNSFSPTEQDNILGGNAIRFYSL